MKSDRIPVAVYRYLNRIENEPPTVAGRCDPSHNPRMGFKKPFRAVPITLGARYRGIDSRRRRVFVLKTLLVAAAIGALIGIASVFAYPNHAPVTKTRD